MKELSIEEKAKAYDEVRTKIKLRFGSNVADEIFSPFEESEDERIRKELLNAFQESEDSLYMVLTPHRRESFVAWLEKQNSNVDNANKEYWKGYREGKQEILDKYAELEKQGEQKPAEEYNITGISSNKSQGKLGEIIKNLKQEWSEEDENYHRICLDLCTGMPNGGVYAPYIKDEAINWLKSLKDRAIPQPVQKWSEEDESILQGIWDEILANKHQAKEYEWKTYDKFLSWLKSIRPQNRWKPSEHEITVLEKIQHGEINPSNPTLHRVIKCLKKLMEE